MLHADTDVLSISEINGLVRELVEESYGDVTVSGEVSNFKRHSSGHLYFTLKDETAQLRAVCFRGTARRIDLDIRDGMVLIVRGRLTVYEGYGQYQLVADQIEEAGQGELELAYRALLKKLELEGLFDKEQKQSLPVYPGRIALVTSPTGAAIQDMLSTLARRWPCVEVILVPVRVQGDMAGDEIVGALDALSRSRGVDLIIVGRGGGSLEDLWVFNEEKVARAIHRCPIPIVSAVGHESDVTIADFVADVRAATPTMAAEISVPLQTEVMMRITNDMNRLVRVIDTSLELNRRRLRELLNSYALGKVRGRIEQSLQTLDYRMDRLMRSVSDLVKGGRASLNTNMARLEALNPREILARGYAICTAPDSDTVIRNVDAALVAGTMTVRFGDGAVSTEVKEKSQ